MGVSRGGREYGQKGIIIFSGGIDLKLETDVGLGGVGRNSLLGERQGSGWDGVDDFSAWGGMGNLVAGWVDCSYFNSLFNFYGFFPLLL